MAIQSEVMSKPYTVLGQLRGSSGYMTCGRCAATSIALGRARKEADVFARSTAIEEGITSGWAPRAWRAGQMTLTIPCVRLTYDLSRNEI